MTIAKNLRALCSCSQSVPMQTPICKRPQHPVQPLWNDSSATEFRDHQLSPLACQAVAHQRLNTHSHKNISAAPTAPTHTPFNHRSSAACAVHSYAVCLARQLDAFNGKEACKSLQPVCALQLPQPPPLPQLCSKRGQQPHLRTAWGLLSACRLRARSNDAGRQVDDARALRVRLHIVIAARRIPARQAQLSQARHAQMQKPSCRESFTRADGTGRRD